MLRPFALDGGKLGVGEDCLNCDLSDLCDLQDERTWRNRGDGWGGCLNCSLSDLCDLRDELTWRVGDVGRRGLSELQFI